ncbi:MAG: bifunctional 4-hydroxy-2-oxoglutarate aldolase/2-dehydro-3-deoxy-phosphogluconate aldolase [Steroidobacteraceae bacterium]
MSALKDQSFMELTGRIAVIPVLTIEQVTDAVPIVAALVSRGLNVLEITMRTECALEAVARVSSEVPEAVVGVGSVIERAQFAAARRVGARFAVSPGATAELEAGARAEEIPWLPGAQSVSEVLALRERGCRFVKFFPAQSSGGLDFLRSIIGPVPDMAFCPTGGITAETARDYLALPNVACVGGSWLTPPLLVKNKNWNEIGLLAERTHGLR